MEPNTTYQKDLESIRKIMERSVKFLSLSGMSGILSGVYALAGAAYAYYFIQYPASPFQYRQESIQAPDALMRLLVAAALVLTASIATGYWLSLRKAKRQGGKLWDSTGKRLLFNLSIPLVAGGLFILLSLFNGHYGIAAPACLLFYGLALINASANLFEEIRYLAYSEIVLGLLATAIPGFGLLFWAIGFGVLHILYGSIMYKKYDR
jgi:hypothetical protein